jgi:hypothetical protein
VAEPAGEVAIEALADFGLMEIISARFGRWTEAGMAPLKSKAPLGPFDYGALPVPPESLRTHVPRKPQSRHKD